MRSLTILLLLSVIGINNCLSKEIFVAKTGNNSNTGTITSPLLTIQAAADHAYPGDTITVFEGVYREKIVPPRGGLSNNDRIVYRAGDEQRVIIKGSEVIKNWENINDKLWKVVISNLYFGEYNPYKDSINGDWFYDLGRVHHTGEVFLNGNSLWECSSLGELNDNEVDLSQNKLKWYCTSDELNTVIYANFGDLNPNNEFVEISVRNSCFYPDNTGVNYITVSGFIMSQAATNWAAPTAEQIGMIGTNWSKGWIIENNEISDSKCVGITLGKDRKSGHNLWNQEKIKGGAVIYNEVILRVIKDGWSKQKIGSHIVRNNKIYNCGQAGICGSFGAAFSEIFDNHIFNIWTKRQFSGAEIAAIKFHGAIDAIIQNNFIHDAHRALWLDWMTQGTRITSNICFRNDFADLFVEVSHGPYLVDNNIFLSGIHNWSQGGAFVHNLISGKIILKPVPDRYTPYHYPNSTELKGFANISCGDDRFYNNIFMDSKFQIHDRNFDFQGFGLEAYDQIENMLPIFAENNLYYGHAKPLNIEKGSIVDSTFHPIIKITQTESIYQIKIRLNQSVNKLNCTTIDSQKLGKAVMTKQIFESHDGNPYSLNIDFSGHPRNLNNPNVGPFENYLINEITLEYDKK